MAVTGVDSHVQAVFDFSMPVPLRRNAFPAAATGTSVGIETSTWTAAGFPGPAPTPASGSGETCNRLTPGAFPIPPAIVGKKIYANYFNLLTGGQAFFKIYDRYVQTSGLSGTVSGVEQAVNTVALPARAGTGQLVQAFLEVYVATGATSTNVTMRYTNQAGVPNKTSITSSVVLNGIGRLVMLNLAPGDTGVQSVQAITLSASTTGAGNFGVTLARSFNFQPTSGSSLAAIPQNATEQGGAQVDDDACLFFSGLYNAASTTILDGGVVFAQA